jgi:hypothetical protein
LTAPNNITSNNKPKNTPAPVGKMYTRLWVRTMGGVSAVGALKNRDKFNFSMGLINRITGYVAQRD